MPSSNGEEPMDLAFDLNTYDDHQLAIID